MPSRAVITGLLQIPREHALGGETADLESGLSRNAADVDRAEIAPGGFELLPAGTKLDAFGLLRIEIRPGAERRCCCGSLK